MKKGITKYLRILGPGLITGAADNDPSGIATYSQAGAQFGFGMLWTLLLTFPLMTSIQEISARIGSVTGRGIAGNIRRYYPRWILYPIVFTLFVVNTLNLGADLQVMGAAMQLLVGGPIVLYSVLFALVALFLEIWVPYSKYVKWLKWLTFALFAYAATVMVVDVPWKLALRSTILPSLHMDRDYLKMFIAVLGTTISPYLFFWQASEEVEDLTNNPDKSPLKHTRLNAPKEFKRIRIDTWVGMGFSNVIAYFIMLTTAATLHTHGITHLDSAAQAAEALRPLAGKFCFLLFSLGLIGSGLLAVPVLAGSAAYAVSESMRWHYGLEKKPSEAKGFYAVVALATLVGLALTFLGVNPIQALIWTAVLNGVISAPIMVIMMLMACNAKVMGDFVLPKGLKIMGWVSTLAMLAATVGLFATGVS